MQSAALPLCCSASATNLKHWRFSPQNIILVKLKLQKNPKPILFEKYTDMLFFAFENTHTISECLERELREKGKKVKRQQTLILTQRALWRAISPNYKEREKEGGSEITPQNKKKIKKNCLWKIWRTSQNTQTFPMNTFLWYAVISYGWPFLSPSVRLLSPLLATFQAPQPPGLTSLLHSLA